MSLIILIVLVQFIIICIVVVLLINKNQIIKAKEGMCKALKKIINDKVKRVGMGEVYVFPPKGIVTNKESFFDTSEIKPKIDSIAEDINNKSSLIITDLKLELYKSMKETLEEKGYIVTLEESNKEKDYEIEL